MNIFPIGVALFFAGDQTDKHEELFIYFFFFANAPVNDT